MKYIRTKDGIFDLSRFKFEKGDIDQSKVGSRQDCYLEQHNIEYCPHRCIWVKDIIKQADTIEELCDEAVFFDKDNKPHYESQEGNIWYLGASLFTETLRFGTFTDKGLIYVAKMNDKGELELL